ncbi:hypothetical protein PF005_g23883 [Phytophthora fragariae]|uniref:Secreted protein n=1 Tax=Phytophthora fragariae TaxID=53985 RepID=A0A6A3R393_9STRA|nr:hypothetical protein PF003_g27797 [Phytophthora fragariae]KAE8931164.1 hypothetical protein PF009_g18761 [Phytophthora fragariae]KAE8969568.1 hypothetical protein PF011_g26752 [Phytophthora fragariae]KAE9067187.1 hypothetical protein PF010_g27566 [Phytophthora fragariae]KAE9082245.1 hypothetical protein PF006_g26957 [Phytophthora fragariae]
MQWLLHIVLISFRGIRSSICIPLPFRFSMRQIKFVRQLRRVELVLRLQSILSGLGRRGVQLVTYLAITVQHTAKDRHSRERPLEQPIDSILRKESGHFALGRYRVTRGFQLVSWSRIGTRA